MRSTTPRVRQLTQLLLALEASSGAARGGQGLAGFSVCETLRPPLAGLAGTAGFRSLLSRALALAGEQVRWLKAVHVNAAGSLEGLDLTQLSAAEIADGEAALVGELIGLLVTFIGEGLTLHLLHEAWPGASFSGAGESERD